MDELLNIVSNRCGFDVDKYTIEGCAIPVGKIDDREVNRFKISENITSSSTPTVIEDADQINDMTEEEAETSNIEVKDDLIETLYVNGVNKDKVFKTLTITEED